MYPLKVTWKTGINDPKSHCRFSALTPHALSLKKLDEFYWAAANMDLTYGNKPGGRSRWRLEAT
ncbi:unnamed protein product [Fusarium graminearum]|uniref:Chromosome 2, complete genome n=1 Tax=Gibberella zeae (strain ATCC MYA-4620 / CBS 123657 / FGSC 9075 / NRRL 31084 / PH-1) TaxID=229533 RepID=A0A098DGJ3_GIBZE|nr:unnamed protein product [Fusarium graminearum]CZS80362.1 unnamed protein product [Fusarium graminearum]